MARYEVKSRFWDAAREAYVNPGAAWSPSDPAQAARLQKAGCIAVAAATPPGGAPAGAGTSTGSGGPAARGSGPTAEELGKLTKAQLLDLAEDRKVAVPDGATKAAIVDALLAAAPPPPAGS